MTSANIELKNQFLALVPDLMKGYNGALSLAHTTHSKFTVPHLYAGVKQVGKGVSSRVSVDKWIVKPLEDTCLNGKRLIHFIIRGVPSYYD